MKKRIIALLSIVLCFTLLLSACGKSSFKDTVVNTYQNTSPKLKSSDKITLFYGETVNMSVVSISNDGRYVVFKNNNALYGEKNMVLYDIVKNSEIASWNNMRDPASLSQSYTTYDSPSFIYVDTDDATIDDDTTIGYYVVSRHYSSSGTTYATVLYDITGKELDSAPREEYPTCTGYNVFFDDCRYVYANGALTQDATYGTFTSLPSISEFSKNYMYEVESVEDYYMSLYSYINVYKYDYTLVSTYTCPMVDSGNYYILDNGNILFQGMRAVPESENDYDLLSFDPSNPTEMVKAKIITQLFDVEKGRVKDLDNKYMFEGVIPSSSESEYSIFGDKFDNYVACCEIKDKRIDQSSYKMYALSNKGKISELPQVVPNQVSIMKFDGVENRYLVQDKADKYFLIDEQENILGDVTSAIRGRFNSKSLYFNGKIYDFNLNFIKEVNSNYSLYSKSANALFFSETYYNGVTNYTKYYKFNADSDSMSEIADTEDGDSLVAVGSQYYVLKERNTGDILTYTYSLYTENGEKLISGAKNLSFASSTEDGMYGMAYSTDGSAYILKA